MSLDPVGVASSWAQLTEAEQSERLHHAGLMWVTTDTARQGRDWESLTELQQRFAAITIGMVLLRTDRVLDTRACAVCWDRVFVSRKRGVWYCGECDTGALAEAGHWRDLRHPLVGRKRVKSDSGDKAWREYADLHPHRAATLRSVTAEIIRREREVEPESGEGP